MSCKLKIPSSIFKSVVGVHLTVSDTGRLNFTNSGLAIRTRSDDKISMVDLTVSAEDMLEYNCKEVAIGIDFTELHSIRGALSETVEVSSDGAELSVVSGRFSTVVQAIHPDAIKNAVKPRQFTLDNTATLDAKELLKFINVARKRSGIIMVTMDNEKVEFAGEEDKIVTHRYTLYKEETLTFESSKDGASALYNANRLYEFLKTIVSYGMSEGGTVPFTFLFNKDYPCAMQFRIAEHSMCEICLAPYIEEER